MISCNQQERKDWLKLHTGTTDAEHEAVQGQGQQQTTPVGITEDLQSRISMKFVFFCQKGKLSTDLTAFPSAKFCQARLNLVVGGEGNATTSSPAATGPQDWDFILPGAGRGIRSWVSKSPASTPNLEAVSPLPYSLPSELEESATSEIFKRHLDTDLRHQREAALLEQRDWTRWLPEVQPKLSQTVILQCLGLSVFIFHKHLMFINMPQ